MQSTRREFVVLTSAATLGLAAKLSAGTIVRVPGTDQGSMPILSVGYWDGLTRGAGDETPAAHIVDAQTAGVDGRFRRAAAMVTTYGFWRAPANRSNPIVVSLIAFYPEIDPATRQKTPFIAWNVGVSGARVEGSLRSKFIVPVDSEDHIELAVDKHAPRRIAASDLDQVRALITDRSTVIDLGAAVTLRPGFYFVALRDKDIQNTPDWSSIRVTQLRTTDRVTPDGDSVLVGADGNAVNFDYIVLLVEPYGVSAGRDTSPADHRG